MFNLKDFINSCKICLSNNTKQAGQQEITKLFTLTFNTYEKRQAALNQFRKYAQDKLIENKSAWIIVQSEDMFLSVFFLSPKMQIATHDHGLWTTIAILQGSCECRCYGLETNSKSIKSIISDELLIEGNVYTLNSNTPHNVFNPTSEPTIELHFYPGDVMQTDVDTIRNLWHPLTHVHEPYSIERMLAISKEVHNEDQALNSLTGIK